MTATTEDVTCPRPGCRSPRSCAHPLAPGTVACAPATPSFDLPADTAVCQSRGHHVLSTRHIAEQCPWEPHEEAPEAPKPPPPPAPRVDFREMLNDDAGRWSVQERLKEQLGRPYLATQLAAALEPDVAARLITRIDELVGPEIERRVAEYTAQLQDDLNRTTADTLARLAIVADEKRRELQRERFRPSRLS